VPQSHGLAKGRAVSAVVAIVALLAGCLAWSATARAQSESVTVTSVVSAEEVLLADGRRLRLAGLAAAAPEDARARRAGRDALAALVSGKAVLLRADAEATDRLGRTAAQVYRASDGLWLQAVLLRAGHARVDPLSVPPPRLAELLTLEAEARRVGRGLWSHPAYALRTSEPAALLPWVGSLQIFEGEVAAVGRGGRDIYINFGEDWRQDTTVRIAREVLGRFERSGLVPGSLEGRRLRIRGWMQSWNGPFVELHDPGQLELLAD